MSTLKPINLMMFRLNARMRQIDVARAIGLQSSDRISEWERGLNYPSVPNLLKLAKLFNVSPSAIYWSEAD